MRIIDSFVKNYAHITQSNDPDRMILASEIFRTPLGSIFVIADDRALYFSDFVDNPHLSDKISRLLKRANAALVDDSTEPIRMFKQELSAYFAGTLQKFTTPVTTFGTPFTLAAWRALQTVPYGKTISYADLAATVGKPTACRAVAQANAQNLLPIIIPCHRVINANGELGGYNSGIERKERLLEHEKLYAETAIMRL